ncbi:MAG: hypothetical protein KC443_08635 [Anaerolineales bacterium]|nr:hypothetical protein [Anaerolineales bacterium]
MTNPANPQSYNRYSYVLNRALNFSDPTGHMEADCMPGENCNFHTPAPSTSPSPVTPGNVSTLPICDDIFCLDQNIADTFSSPCYSEYDVGTWGHVEDAYNVYQQFGHLTYEELLALIIIAEFGTARSSSDYFLYLEALGRQFFQFCTSGTCASDQLWRLLGGFEAWYNSSVTSYYENGTYKDYLGDAQVILNHPQWQKGAGSNRPWIWGSTFNDDEITKIKAAYSFVVDYGEEGKVTYTMGGYLTQSGGDWILTFDQKLAQQAYTKCVQGKLSCMTP